MENLFAHTASQHNVEDRCRRYEVYDSPVTDRIPVESSVYALVLPHFNAGVPITRRQEIVGAEVDTVRTHIRRVPSEASGRSS